MKSDIKIVLFGDVVRSREIHGRRAFGAHLRDLLAEVEGRDASPFTTPFLVTGVDGFVAAADRPDGILDAVLAILLGVRPQRIRVVVSRGAVDVGARSRDPSKMDGPAFHHAAEAIQRIERESSTLGFTGFGPALDHALNAAGALLSVALDSWTDRQAEVIDQIRWTGSRKAAAEALEISPQAVSNAVRQTRYANVERALDRIDQALHTAADADRDRKRR